MLVGNKIQESLVSTLSLLPEPDRLLMVFTNPASCTVHGMLYYHWS